MTDEERWLILYHGLLSSGEDITIANLASLADKALVEYKKRWEDPVVVDMFSGTNDPDSAA